jgi:D-glycero-D-manno-heptose 1,7-bisphosphate phosphatase
MPSIHTERYPWGTNSTSAILKRSLVNQAVFIDRDGVICRNREDHVKRWEEFVFLPGALAALARLAACDLLLVVVTNQAAINREIVSSDVVEEIHRRMVAAIEAHGGRIDRVIYCPHRPDERCACRKPRPGMLLQAAGEYNIDLSHSFLIGDAESDMRAGQAAGIRSRYLVLTGRGRWEFIRCLTHGEWGFKVVPNLAAAANAVRRAHQVTARSWRFGSKGSAGYD